MEQEEWSSDAEYRLQTTDYRDLDTGYRKQE